MMEKKIIFVYDILIILIIGIGGTGSLNVAAQNSFPIVPPIGILPGPGNPSSPLPSPGGPIGGGVGGPIVVDVNLNTEALEANLNRISQSFQNIDSAISSFLPEVPRISDNWNQLGERWRTDFNTHANRAQNTMDVLGTRFADIGDSAMSAWNSTNSSLEKVIDTVTDPGKMMILSAAVASGAVLGSAFTQLIIKGITWSVQSLAHFIQGRIEAPQKLEAGLLQDFINADKNYEQLLRMAKMVEQQFIYFARLIHLLHQETKKSHQEINQKDSIGYLLEVVADLEVSNERYLLENDNLKERLQHDPTEETISCAVNNKVKIEQSNRKIKIARNLMTVLDEGPAYSPCIVLQDLFKTMVLAEENLEKYRGDILAAEDLWQKKYESEKLISQDKFKRGRKSLSVLQNKVKEISTSHFEEWKKDYIEAIKMEVQACMEKMGETFARKYPDGRIEWAPEFIKLKNQIKTDFGKVKTTDQFTAWSWGEWVTGKSFLHHYCEAKVYNEPYLDLEKNLKITRLDHFYSQIHLMKVAHMKKAENLKNLKHMQSSVATTMLRGAEDESNRDYVHRDHSFIRMTQDQICYQDPSRCDNRTKARVTHSRMFKQKLVNLCGSF